MNEILEELLRIKEDLEKRKVYYLVSDSLPEKLLFDKDTVPTYLPAVLLLPSATTYLDNDLLIIHPNHVAAVKAEIGHMIRPITDLDWKRANEAWIKRIWNGDLTKAQYFPGIADHIENMFAMPGAKRWTKEKEDRP